MKTAKFDQMKLSTYICVTRSIIDKRIIVFFEIFVLTFNYSRRPSDAFVLFLRFQDSHELPSLIVSEK